MPAPPDSRELVAMVPKVRGLGCALAAAGLTTAGARRHLGLSHPAAASWFDAAGAPSTAAQAILPRLFVAGHRLPAESLDGLGNVGQRLVDSGLVAVVDLHLIARIALIPTGRHLIACDRRDSSHADRVAVPDDSSYHVLGCLPASARSWLDVGCGNGALALAHGPCGDTVCSDLHSRAVAMARLGLAIAGDEHTRVRCSDLFADVVETYALITFNAPLPRARARGSGPRFSHPQGDDDVLSRFWSEVGAHLAGDGEVLVHSWQPRSDFPASLGLAGSVQALRYTPPHADDAFGVTRWCPSEPTQITLTQVELGRDLPHLRRRLLEGQPEGIGS